MLHNRPRLWLLRHAQPLIAAGRCYGRLDVPADAALTAEAARAGASALPTGAVLRHSPLARCQQLLQALTELRPDLQPGGAPDSRLQEMDFGAWEGQPWEAIARSEIDAWADMLYRYAPGRGESLEQMLQRVRQALGESWLVDSLQGQREVVWITHAGVIRCVQWLLQAQAVPPTSASWQLPAPGFGGWLTVDWQRTDGGLQAG